MIIEISNSVFLLSSILIGVRKFMFAKTDRTEMEETEALGTG